MLILDYARFERLAIGVGVVAVVGNAMLSLVTHVDPVELVAQLLFLAVVLAAVRWGSKGGAFAAYAAVTFYVAMRFLTIPPATTTLDLLAPLTGRATAYLAVGIIGGEVCNRIRIMLAKAKDARAIDESSSAYTPQFLARRIVESAGRFERYGEEFSLVVICVDSRGTDPARKPDLVRAVVDQLRAGLRLVDEVGRLPEDDYGLLLPHTGGAGAHVVAERLRADLKERLAIGDESLTVRVLTAADDLAAIRDLAAEVAPAPILAPVAA
jgi:hypothetical protein